MTLVKRYNGAEPCPCCGVSGNEKPRFKKNGLCDDCSCLVRIGKEYKQFYDNQLTDMSTLQLNGIANPFFYVGGKFDNKSTGKMLSNLINSIPFPKNVGYRESAGKVNDKYNTCWSDERVTVPNSMVQPIKDLVSSLQELAEFLEEQYKYIRYEYKQQIENELKAEYEAKKQELIEQGRKEGKNLLMMLNKGEITANEMI